MSQENVEIVRSGHEAISRGDYAKAVEYLHPEVEVYPVIVGPDQRSRYEGRDGCREFLETLRIWEEQWIEAEELIRVPGGRVLAVECWHTRGRDGITVDFKLIDVYSFRDGLIVRIDGYLDKAEALEAAGLSE